jgi:hypothetical protein
MKSPPPKPQSGQCPKSQAQERPFELLSPQEKLAKAQATADHWSQIAADPELKPPSCGVGVQRGEIGKGGGGAAAQGAQSGRADC